MTMVTKSIKKKDHMPQQWQLIQFVIGVKIKYYSEISTRKNRQHNMIIQNYLPHRYPFLLIDKVIKIEKVRP